MKKTILLFFLLTNCSNDFLQTESKIFIDYQQDAGLNDLSKIDNQIDSFHTNTSLDASTNTTDILISKDNLIINDHSDSIDPTTLFKDCSQQYNLSLFKELIIDCYNIADCVYDRIYKSGIQWKCAVYLGDLILKNVDAGQH